MKKPLLEGSIFLLLTLLIPLLLTRIFSRSASTSNLPALDEIKIFPSSGDTIPLTLEEYVEGVVLATIPVNYHYETLQAQAIIVRTYALKNISICNNERMQTALVDTIDPHSRGYTVKELGLEYLSPDSCMEYIGTLEYENYVATVKQAVKETDGLILTYDDQLITPLFFPTSAGRTRNSADLWTIPIPYLVSVDSNQDIESPNYLKVTISSIDSVIQKLQLAYQNRTLDISDYDYQVYPELPLNSDSFFQSVDVIKRDSAGYVLTVSLGGILVSGDSFSNVLGLCSSCFYLENYEDSVRMICNGIGHGIGFSQYGANVLAEHNEASYTDLLTYYYTGIEIKKVSSLYS